jgi:hypothetical protein
MPRLYREAGLIVHDASGAATARQLIGQQILSAGGRSEASLSRNRLLQYVEMREIPTTARFARSGEESVFRPFRRYQLARLRERLSDPR